MRVIPKPLKVYNSRKGLVRSNEQKCTHRVEDCVGSEVPIPLCQAKEFIQIHILALKHQAMLLSIGI